MQHRLPIRLRTIQIRLVFKIIAMLTPINIFNKQCPLKGWQDKRCKHLLLLFVATVCIVFSYNTNLQAQNYTVLEGQITNPQEKEVNITVVTDYLKYDRTIISTPVSEDGKFLLAFKPSAPMLVRFEHAFENMLIYVLPGERTKMSFKGLEMWKTMHFEGESANNNNYMVQYFNEFEKEVDQIYIDLEPGEMSQAAFNRYINQQKQKRWKFYQNYTKNQELTDGFDDYAQGDILYNWAFDKLRFAELNDWNLKKDYYQFLDTLTIVNSQLITSEPYINFVDVYLNYLYYVKNKASQSNMAVSSYYTIDNKFNGNLKFYLQARVLKRAFLKEDINTLDQAYKHFIDNNPYNDYTQEVSKQYELAKKFASGSRAPDFQFTTLEGEKLWLSDFRGKVVYLAFWASWCNPCLQQIKYAKSVLQDVNTDELVFLYVSIDEDENTWRNTVKEREIPGIHLYTQGTKTLIPREYNIAGVPVYFMIDQAGNFTEKPPLLSTKTAFINKVNQLLNKNDTRIEE